MPTATSVVISATGWRRESAHVVARDARCSARGAENRHGRDTGSAHQYNVPRGSARHLWTRGASSGGLVRHRRISYAASLQRVGRRDNL